MPYSLLDFVRAADREITVGDSDEPMMFLPIARISSLFGVPPRSRALRRALDRARRATNSTQRQRA